MMKSKEEKALLLRLSSQKEKAAGEEGSQRISNIIFKGYVVASMVTLMTCYTLSIRFTRSTTPPDEMYFSTTVVVLSEMTKFTATTLLLWKEKGFSFQKLGKSLHQHYFTKPVELMKMSVPAMAYALQSNLDFVALSNLEAGIYQITSQLKLVTTAFFMMAFLGRKFSKTRWIAIFFLFAGVATVQLNNLEKTSHKKEGENYLLGIISVLATCITSGFAGVYCEKMLKDGVTPFWIRNLQLYTNGIVAALIGCLSTQGKDILKQGFFHGYNINVLAIAGFLSTGGLCISLVMKHLDNIHKAFCSAVSIILIVFLSLFLFEGITLGIYFFGGMILVCTAIYMYNSVPE